MTNKKYKEPKLEEMETTINLLYLENILSIYTNNVKLQKRLNKIIGEPRKESTIKGAIVSSVWDISLTDERNKDNIIDTVLKI